MVETIRLTFSEQFKGKLRAVKQVAYKAFMPEALQRNKFIKDSSLPEKAEMVAGVAFIAGSLIPGAGGLGVNSPWALAYLGLRAYHLARESIENLRNPQASTVEAK